jgi:hypothetical protein
MGPNPFPSKGVQQIEVSGWEAVDREPPEARSRLLGPGGSTGSGVIWTAGNSLPYNEVAGVGFTRSISHKKTG